MSIFPRLRAERMPTDWAGPGRAAARAVASIFGNDCALCGARSPALVCGACDLALPRARAACERCALPLPRPGTCGRCRRCATPVDAAVAAFDYRFPVDRLVRRFKYAGDLAVGRWLGESLAARVAGEARPALIVVPASTRARLRERGFNPALEIAKATARRLRRPYAIGGLVRTRETSPQPGLGRDARRRNLAGAFACGLDLRGLHVALVDDVLTTGATVEAAAAALKHAGAERVVAWIVARTPDHV